MPIDVIDRMLEGEGLNDDGELSTKLRKRLARLTRGMLLKFWRIARVLSRKRGAYFWRNLKVTTWRLLAGLDA